MKALGPILLLAALCLGGCLDGPAVAAAGQADHHAEARRLMVEDQLRARGIRNAKVLAAMGRVPRHEYVPAPLHALAYADRPLPIGHGQTISQPFIVAFMTEALDPASTDRVLEIGTGSGYQAAVLAELVARVYTIEIVPPLGERARADLARLKVDNVEVRVGDGYEGWPEQAPFDAIIVTCSPEKVPQPLVDQLRDGGRMVIPVGEVRGEQVLYLLEKRGTRVVQRAILPVRFVPMTGKAQGR
ncbi:MAG: protein-L-isoaspartate(D-aspartate) O-methyltransferase [Betaproteobacteria bacterium]|nr:protein-L-isoaspartate(D-aspartate) O-methyltransferase [Betaproteobacteria bacterium]